MFYAAPSGNRKDVQTFVIPHHMAETTIDGFWNEALLRSEKIYADEVQRRLWSKVWL